MKNIEQVIMDGIRSELKLVIDEEIANAVKNIEQRVRSQTDRIALKMLSYYTLERHEGTIRIEVRKDL